MEGVEAEHAMFKRFHPQRKILLVPAPGGAARQLAESLGTADAAGLSDVDFARLFHVELAPAALQ
jgi:hypothetical protein